MIYMDKMLKIPYDKHDGISVNQVESLCHEADKEIAELKERITLYEQCVGGVGMYLFKAVDELKVLDKTLTARETKD